MRWVISALILLVSFVPLIMMSMKICCIHSWMYYSYDNNWWNYANLDVKNLSFIFWLKIMIKVWSLWECLASLFFEVVDKYGPWCNSSDNNQQLENQNWQLLDVFVLLLFLHHSMNCPPTKRLRGLNHNIATAVAFDDPFGDDEDFTQDDLDEIDVIASQALTSATAGAGLGPKPVEPADGSAWSSSVGQSHNKSLSRATTNQGRENMFGYSSSTKGSREPFGEFRYFFSLIFANISS